MADKDKSYKYRQEISQVRERTRKRDTIFPSG